MSPWFDVLQLAQKNAPRVGNSRCPADSELFSMAKALLNDMVLESLLFAEEQNDSKFLFKLLLHMHVHSGVLFVFIDKQMKFTT